MSTEFIYTGTYQVRDGRFEDARQKLPEHAEVIEANEPRLVLADEPTASLEGKLGQQAMRLFEQIAHERRAAVLVVTHDHRTLDVCDRILDVADGKIKSRVNHKRIAEVPEP